MKTLIEWCVIKNLTNGISTFQDCCLRVIEAKNCDIALANEKLAKKEVIIEKQCEAIGLLMSQKDEQVILIDNLRNELMLIKNFRSNKQNKMEKLRVDEQNELERIKYAYWIMSCTQYTTNPLF